jgi:plastocyanin
MPYRKHRGARLAGPRPAAPPSKTPKQRNLRRLGVLAGTSGLLLACAGCGTSVKSGDNPDLIAGKVAFVAKCGSCHTLARANTKGIVGPNLDDAFRVDVSEGLERNTIRGVVEYQVRYPNPEGAMPKDLVSGATLENIAAYVAESAARPGQDTGLLASAVAPAGAGKPAVEQNGKLQIAANPAGQLAYVTNKATATAGPVTVEMPNMSGVTHNLAIQSGTGPTGPILGATKFISKGSTSVTVNLKPGTYTFFCQVPGHRQAGMEGTITVK